MFLLRDLPHETAIRRMLERYPESEVSAVTSCLGLLRVASDLLAAMEAQFRTEKNAPLRLGGWPDVKNETVHFAIEIPGALSWIALPPRFSGPPREPFSPSCFP